MLRSLDVLIAMMHQVKLKKENQLELMSGIKIFLADIKTKKKGYKLLSLIVSRYTLDQGIQELVQIHQELTPLMEGQSTKPRLRLIKAYVDQIKNFVVSQANCPLEQVDGLLKHYIIELITAMSNSNVKIRSIAQDIFTEICTIMRVNFNSVNRLFTIILVGLSGKAST